MDNKSCKILYGTVGRVQIVWRILCLSDCGTDVLYMGVR